MILYCEDCNEDVYVYGGYDLIGEFIEEDREGHEGHDLSTPTFPIERTGK